MTYQIFYRLNKFFSSSHREIAQCLSKIGAYLFDTFRIPDIQINDNIYMKVFFKGNYY